MFLRRIERKTHSYPGIVENKCLDDGLVARRRVLYLGEISSSQAAAWRKAIEGSASIFTQRIGLNANDGAIRLTRTTMRPDRARLYWSLKHRSGLGA